MKTTFFFLLLSFSSLTFAHSSISKGILERSKTIRLTARQIVHLESLILDEYGDYNKANFPTAYHYILDLLKERKDVDQGTLFWFQKAPAINAGTGASSYMIRSYSMAGLELAGRKAGDLQKISDDIAINVLQDIINRKGIAPLHIILASDISAAMKTGNIKDLAGWGGSFFYWQMPMLDSKNRLIIDPYGDEDDDYVTIGEDILRDNDKKERFIKTCIVSFTSVPYKLAFADIPGIIKSTRAIKALPSEVRTPILEGIIKRDALMGYFLDAID